MLLIYFFVGIVFDILITIYTQAIIDERWFKAGLFSMIVTLFQISVIGWLVFHPDNFVDNTVAYAIGCGIGTALMVWYKKQDNEKNHNWRRS